MTPRHHPSDDTLLAFAMAAVPPGAALVIRMHLSFCVHCRRSLRLLDHLGGALLETMPPQTLPTGAVIRATAAVEGASFERAPPRAAETPGELIKGLRHGPWRPFTPGLEVADVEGGFEDHETVCLLKCKAGSPVPRHGHEQVERFIVLEGGFGIDETVYWPGDFIEADDSETHTPFVPPDADCLCLFALEGGLRFEEPSLQHK